MRYSVALLVLALAVGAAPAHFIFLIPDAERTSATMVFSDTLEPDEGVPITKIARTKLFALDASGKSVPVKMTEQKHHYDVAVPPERPMMVAGVCQYGVLTKKGEPFLLMYYPKTVLFSNDKSLKDVAWLGQGSKELPLEIVRGEDDDLKVLFQGKPLGGAELVFVLDNVPDSPVEGVTDAKGRFNPKEAFAKLRKEGKTPPSLVGIRAKHVEKKEGEADGKKYSEVRHYATMVIRRGMDKR